MRKSDFALLLEYTLWALAIMIVGYSIHFHWGGWRDNIICGTIAWKNQGIEAGKYEAYSDYEFVIDFESGYGRRTMDVPADTYISYKVGDRICYDLQRPEMLTAMGFITMIILVITFIIAILAIIWAIIRFHHWLYDIPMKGS